jgi:hypothetical protein
MSFEALIKRSPNDSNRMSGHYPLGDAPVVGGGVRGLFWADGIEPVESAIYPLAAGKRIWYVDLDAVTNGNGDENTPFNNFTTLCGYINGSFSYVQGSLAGGDQIYMTGTGIPSKHTNGVSNMDIRLLRASQMGTVAEPTVIRSWKGRSRAVMDGQYTDFLGIFAEVTSFTVGGLVVLNIEATANTSPGITMDSGISHIRVVSCYAHRNGTAGGAGTLGGIQVTCKSFDGVYDIEVHNCKTEFNDTEDGVTYGRANGNSGGIMLLSETSSNAASTVKFYANEMLDEHQGVFHKHAGHCVFSSYNNYIARPKDVAQYLRVTTENNIYDNDVEDAIEDVRLVAENTPDIRTLNYHGNTLTRVDKMIVATNNGVELFHNVVNWYDNVYNNPSYADPVITFGRYASAVSTIAFLTGSNNVIDKTGNDILLENQVVRDLAYYAAQTNDTTTAII